MLDANLKFTDFTFLVHLLKRFTKYNFSNWILIYAMFKLGLNVNFQGLDNCFLLFLVERFTSYNQTKY